MILARKIVKIPDFLYLPEKFTKFPNSTCFFCPKNVRILVTARKYFPEYYGGGRAPLLPRLLRLWLDLI